MITDEMLAVAAGEVSEAMVSSVEVYPHMFSASFVRRLRRLIHRAEHPVRYQLMRHVAAILIAAVTIFGILFATNPEVRAAVISWVRSFIGNDIEYSTNETTPPNIQCSYKLAADPDEYELLTEIDFGSGIQYIYVATDGSMMAFFYTYDTDELVLRMHDITDYAYSSGYVGDFVADIYIAPSTTETSVIVWHDTDDNVFFSISVVGNQEKLLSLAEKIEKIEN